MLIFMLIVMFAFMILSMINGLLETAPYIILAVVLAVLTRHGLDFIRPQRWWSGKVKDGIMVTVGLISFAYGSGAGLLATVLALVSKAIL